MTDRQAVRAKRWPLACLQGGISLKTSEKGKFGGFVALEFWVYVGITGYAGSTANIPDVNVVISGDQVTFPHPQHDVRTICTLLHSALPHLRHPQASMLSQMCLMLLESGQLCFNVLPMISQWFIVQQGSKILGLYCRRISLFLTQSAGAVYCRATATRFA